MFTKKNFEQVAVSLATIAPAGGSKEVWEQFERTITVFTELFANDNAKFDRTRFIQHMLNNMNRSQINDYVDKIGATLVVEAS